MRYEKYRIHKDPPDNPDNWITQTLFYMSTQQTMEERLWDYIDGLSSPAEKSAIEELIAANLEWQQQYRELLNVHQMMGQSELEEPSLRFSKNVMEEIARLQVAPATKTYINKNVIRSIGGFFLAMIAGFLVYCLSQFKWADSHSSSMVPQYNIDVEKYNPGKFMNSTTTTIFTLIAAVLALMLLDAWLQRQKEKTQHKEA